MAELRLPEPAVINEPLKTSYIGTVAAEAPDSWEKGRSEVKFFRTEESHTPDITFYEYSVPAGIDIAVKIESYLNAFSDPKNPVKGNTIIVGREDLSRVFGRPAAVGQFITFVSHFTRFDYPCLMQILLVAESQGYLVFIYDVNLPNVDIEWLLEEQQATFFTDWQQRLTDWALDFLPRYKWVGDNNFQPGKSLFTDHGQIALGEEWPKLLYELDTSIGSKSHSGPMLYNEGCA